MITKQSVFLSHVSALSLAAPTVSPPTMNDLLSLIPIMLIGHEWIPDEINKGHLEYFFLLLAAIMVLNFTCFLLIAKNYTYVQSYKPDPPPSPDGVPQTLQHQYSAVKYDSANEKTPLLLTKEEN